MSQAPIGLMDSGFGGLTVWREVQQLLPSESILYFADSAYCPYGSRPQEEVFELVNNVVMHLISRGCKLIVLACNTATAVAIKELRQRYEVPFVGMEPALKPAAKLTKSGVIGILATENTFKGAHFHQTKNSFASDKKLVIQPGYGLVELVESGDFSETRAKDKLRPLLEKMKQEGVDQLVLGCTHYPFLEEEIQQLLGAEVNLIDPAPAVARQVKRILAENDLLNSEKSTGKHHFLTSGKLVSLRNFIERKLLDQDHLPKVYEKVWL